jgi:hypothetical protein
MRRSTSNDGAEGENALIAVTRGEVLDHERNLKGSRNPD